MRLFLDEQTQGVVVIGKTRVGGERLQRLGRQGSQLGGYECRLRRQLHLQLGHPGLERHEFGFAGILVAAHEGIHVQPNDIQHDGVELFHAFQHGGCVGQLALIRSKAGLFRDSRLNLAVQCLIKVDGKPSQSSCVAKISSVRHFRLAGTCSLSSAIGTLLCKIIRLYYTTEKGFWQQDLPKAFEFFASSSPFAASCRTYSVSNRASRTDSRIQTPAIPDRIYQRFCLPCLSECAMTSPTTNGATGTRNPFRT